MSGFWNRIGQGAKCGTCHKDLDSPAWSTKNWLFCDDYCAAMFEGILPPGWDKGKRDDGN